MAEVLTPGTVFAGYTIERLLGAGGMGAVYSAWHPRLPRRDALKILPQNFSASAEFRARFLREAEMAARLDQRNIVAVHDRGEFEGRLWIATEYVDGFDAAELLRRAGALPPERVVQLVGAVAEGLDEAHRSGVLHRDVKPANILIEPVDGDAERVLVADFGIARAAGDGTALTEVGTVVATVAYAAPEVLSERQVDHRADVYALGCTVFELLTGSRPFPRDSMVAVMRAHLGEPPPRARELRPGLPPGIDAVIARAMAKNPDDRYPSCGALAAAVAGAFGHQIDPTMLVARPPSLPEQPTVADRPTPPRVPPAKPRKPRRRRYAALAAVILAVLVVVTGVLVVQRDSPEPAKAAPVSAPRGVTWGKYQFMVDALPQLLPARPVTTGYQGIRCAAIDDETRRPVDLNKVPRVVARIACSGNYDPVSDVDIRCTMNRTPFYLADEHPLGDLRWERRSGRGRVTWADIAFSDRPLGLLGLEFEDAARNFCQVAVMGGANGKDLYDRWWPDAPF
ncbi:serine/threonine-protein kinase [Nocardia sp. NPDC051832]|uniref:serine/threonine-protein kinase n=1 Tax=Nocardia sp. NPDC051832 TaxID=3155673 RepID=UPI00344303D4